MHEIRQLLRIAARRLELGQFLKHLHLVALVLASATVVLMLLDRLRAETVLPWAWLLPVMIGAGLLVALMLWSRSRPSELHVAVQVDERLDLREKLTTALQVADRDDPFARAAIEDAVRTASDPRVRETAKRRFNVAAPSGWWASPALIFLAMVVSFLQPMNLFEREQPEDPAVTQARHEVRETLDAVMKTIEEYPELSGELSDLLGELTKDGTDPDALRRPEDVRRDALRRMSDLNQRLEDILGGEKGKTAEALERSMKNLKLPEDGPAKEFAEALAQGDFKQAREALQDLMEQLKGDELTPEQQQQMQEQLAQLGEQLEQMAQQQEQLEEALRDAGMDPQLAQNPEALQRAIEQNQNLNEQQRQQLQQMAQAQQQANQMCQNLAQAMQDMAQAMQGMDGEAGEGAGQAGEAAMDALAQMEMLQQMLDQAQAAAEACRGSCQGLGQGLGMSQDWLRAMGQGMGDRSDQGSAGSRPSAPTPTRTRKVRAEGETGEGDIIARMLVDGPQVVGESHINPRQIVVETVEGLEQAIEEERVPRRYHEAMKHYFGELDRQTRTVAEGDAPASAANED